jgi:GTP cyclohydrolase II
MKLLINRGRKSKLINKLRFKNLELIRELDEKSSLLELYKSDSFKWEDQKYELLEIKRKYIMLLEKLELNDERFYKATTHLLRDAGKGNIYIMSNKYEK